MTLPRIDPRLFRLLLLVGMVVLLLVVLVEPALAKGGGVGGGSSFGRSSGGGSGFGSSGGSYGGGYRGTGGGGFGLAPLLFLPFLGSGGGSLLLIVLIVVLFFWGRGLLRGVAGGMGRARSQTDGGGRGGDATIAQLDLALLGSASAVPGELRRLVSGADTSDQAGYAALLQDAALLLLRHREYWHSAAFETQVTSYGNAEARYQQQTLAARARLTYETVTNVGGRVRHGTAPTAVVRAPDESGGRFIVVTLVVAALAPLPDPPGLDADGVDSALRTIAGLPARALEAAEVIWVPDGPEEPLTNDELLAQFPTLTGV